MRSPKAVELNGIRSSCWSPPTQRKLDTIREGRGRGEPINGGLVAPFQSDGVGNLGYVEKAKTDRKKSDSLMFSRYLDFIVADMKM